MRIILEGPDGAGKTYLAEELQAEFPELGYSHEGPPPKELEPYHYYVARLHTHIESFPKGFILDRFALGERVYGPIFRGQSRLSYSEWLRLRTLFSELHVVQVMCLPPLTVAHKAWSSGRAEMIVNHETFRRTYHAFRELQSECAVRYDWTQPNALNHLIRFLKERKGHARHS